MVTKQVTSVWTMGGWQPPVGQSFQGFQHQAEDLPNQDAYCIEQYDVTNSTLCVLADGSGGPEAIRSDAGSKIAVQTFRKVIENEIFPLLRKDTLDPAALENTWSLVGKKIEKIWIEECLNHLRENPFSEEENQFRLETDELVERPICAYTTTLSGALLTQEFGLFLHLGDAEIMLTEGAGQTESISQPATEANQTAITLGSIHSLPFHPRVISGPEWQSKELVFLATDGVRDAFPDRDELSQHVSGYLNAWRNKGSHRKLSIMTRDSCHRFASESGSGGDATLLIVKRVQKEDILSRGEFEKAWVDFERNRTNLLAEVSQTRNDLKKELEDISIRLRQSAQSTETDLRKTTENLSRAIESVGNDHRQKVDQLGNSIREHFLSYETGMKENQQEIERLKKNQQFIYPALSAGAFAFVLAVFALLKVSSVSSDLAIETKLNEELSKLQTDLETEINNESTKIRREFEDSKNALDKRILINQRSIRGIPKKVNDLESKANSLQKKNETLESKISQIAQKQNMTAEEKEAAGDAEKTPAEGDGDEVPEPMPKIKPASEDPAKEDLAGASGDGDKNAESGEKKKIIEVSISENYTDPHVKFTFNVGEPIQRSLEKLDFTDTWEPRNILGHKVSQQNSGLVYFLLDYTNDQILLYSGLPFDDNAFKSCKKLESDNQFQANDELSINNDGRVVVKRGVDEIWLEPNQ